MEMHNFVLYIRKTVKQRSEDRLSFDIIKYTTIMEKLGKPKSIQYQTSNAYSYYSKFTIPLGPPILEIAVKEGGYLLDNTRKQFFYTVKS